jgi:hypothetical protein
VIQSPSEYCSSSRKIRSALEAVRDAEKTTLADIAKTLGATA